MDVSSLTVVGIGADGWEGLPASVQRIVASADVLVGAPRQLALVPERDPAGVPEPHCIAVPGSGPIAVLGPDPIAVLEPDPIGVPEPDPIAVLEPDPIGVPEPEPIAVPEPDCIGVPEPDPIADPRPVEGLPGPIAVPEPGPIAVPEPVEGLPRPTGPRRVEWPRPLRAGLDDLLAGLSGQVVALASGDPLVSGIGSTLVEVLGAERVRIVPAPSSVALARAELRWPAESCAVVSVVGRPVELVARELAPGRRVLVLGEDEHTPGRLAELLCEHGFGASVMHLLGDLGSSAQTHRVMRADEFSGQGPRLAVIGLDLVGPRRAGWTGGLPDEAYENDGQLTKRDLRASALARLAPVPGEHLWDVGAGAGSIGIEWARAHPSCRVTAIEADEERADRIGRNAARLGVPATVQVVRGRAPEALSGLDRPDAVFIGGGASVPGVLERCVDALAGRGRIVVHAVTLETEQTLAQAYRRWGGELTRIHVETAAAIGHFTGWTPARTLTQWYLDLG